jgi:hypothetical protein
MCNLIDRIQKHLGGTIYKSKDLIPTAWQCIQGHEKQNMQGVELELLLDIDSKCGI